MNPLKTQGFLKTNSPSFGRRDEPKIPHKENPLLKDCFRLDALQFSRKRVRNRVTKVHRQGNGADGRSIVELYPIRLAGRAKLALSLQISDRIDERGIHPRFSNASRLRQRDEVG